MNTYQMGTREDKKSGTLAKLSGFDMPWAVVVQESATHVTIKVPGHSVWVGYSLGSGKNTTYIPAEFQVFEKLPDGTPNSPHHNVKQIVSFPVKHTS